MSQPNQGSALAGSFRIFGVAGISVYVHWSWLVIGYLELQFRTSAYQFWAWNVAEYLTLFLIVLLHEFGHALACRQVGGRANEIVLWPLGGIAFVIPPPRPGALLWSIAAGPLVNLALVPVTIGAVVLAQSQGLQGIDADADHFLWTVMILNAVLLIFNMLPIYPLDGGQILQAVLWFFIGRATSLQVASVVGMVGAAAGIVLAVFIRSVWFGIMGAFAAYRCWQGFQQAKLLALLENAPRHRDARCPSCDAHPLEGPFWQCDECHARFDTFTYQAQCPGCGKQYPLTACPECLAAHPFWAWLDPDDKGVHTAWDEPKTDNFGFRRRE
jgi:Zn-dependent protease